MNDTINTSDLDSPRDCIFSKIGVNSTDLSWFNPIACFQKSTIDSLRVEQGLPKRWQHLHHHYCFVESTIVLVSLVIWICLWYLLIHLLVNTARTKRKVCCRILFTSFRFYSIMQMGGVCLSQIIHFTFYFSMYTRTHLSANEICMKNLGMFFSLYYVFKKALKPLAGERKKWLQTICQFYAVTFFLNIITIARM